MKICVVSFDIWGYDQLITSKMNELGYDAKHIRISQFKYRYKNFFDKVNNAIQKIFLNKNVKKIEAEKYIIKQLELHKNYDKIIVINPEWISKETHLKIKCFSDSYIAYLYDSLNRYDATHLLDIFEKVYSFDKNDAEKYNLTFLPNFIPWNKEINIENKTKYKVFSISSIDERFSTFVNIIRFLDSKKVSHLSIFYNKKKPVNFIKTSTFTDKRISNFEVKKLMKESDIILDILREKQSGLSFRIFEALALEKKVITTNPSIKEYDFYDSNNILILDPKNINISDEFLNSEYKKIPEDIFYKYTLENWIKTILK